MQTIGLSPKIIGPVAAALAAFAQAKINDQATAALIIALIGAVALYFSPPGLVIDEPDEDIDPEVAEEWHEDAGVKPDAPA